MRRNTDSTAYDSHLHTHLSALPTSQTPMSDSTESINWLGGHHESDDTPYATPSQHLLTFHQPTSSEVRCRQKFCTASVGNYDSQIGSFESKVCISANAMGLRVLSSISATQCNEVIPRVRSPSCVRPSNTPPACCSGEVMIMDPPLAPLHHPDRLSPVLHGSRFIAHAHTE